MGFFKSINFVELGICSARVASMKFLKIYILLFVALFVSMGSVRAGELRAKPATEYIKKSVVYQIMLQTFTQEGTLKKAEEMLPHIKNLGVDIIYLCPIVEHDDDTDRRFWSKRQKESNLNNPKNPYRMKDYFKIDSNYGTEADLKSYVDVAHKLGMKVLLDLVYYHCGPKANFIKTNPDFIRRNERGEVVNGRWFFPELNFGNHALREYLIENMIYFVRDFNVDGYRTDVEASVPADFWTQAYRRLKKVKPDVIMFAESRRADAQVEVYDANYSFNWYYPFRDVLLGKKSAEILPQIWEKENKRFVKGARQLRYLDNHDTSSDCGDTRFEKALGFDGMNMVHVLNFTLDGIPFIFMGNEIADSTAINMFSSPKYGRHCVGWNNALTEKGKARYALIQKLVVLHKENSALYDGSLTWLENTKADAVLSFLRQSKYQEILIVANLRNESVKVSVMGEFELCRPIMENGTSYKRKESKIDFELAPYSYGVFRVKSR